MQRYALLIGMLASVGLVIAVINILNLMLARVLKRTKAVGLSMALGSSAARCSGSSCWKLWYWGWRVPSWGSPFPLPSPSF